MPVFRMTVEVLPFDFTKVCPRLMIGCPLASSEEKAEIEGVDDRPRLIDSDIIVVIALRLAVVTWSTPVTAEPAASVLVISFAVPRRSVVEDPRVLSPTEPMYMISRPAISVALKSEGADWVGIGS